MNHTKVCLFSYLQCWSFDLVPINDHHSTDTPDSGSISSFSSIEGTDTRNSKYTYVRLIIRSHSWTSRTARQSAVAFGRCWGGTSCDWRELETWISSHPRKGCCLEDVGMIFVFRGATEWSLQVACLCLLLLHRNHQLCKLAVSKYAWRAEPLRRWPTTLLP